MPPKDQGHARTKLLGAALYVIRAQGFSASSVDDICAAAGVTKGAFFHHFKSKEDLGIAAVQYFSAMAASVFADAPYRAISDPVQRLLGYIDFRKAILKGELPDFTCLAGTMVQETYDTYPAIRAACNACISEHADQVAVDIAAAMKARKLKTEWSAQSLALYTQAVLQGAFILAKAKHGPGVAADCIDHLRQYLECIFSQQAGKGQ